MKKTVPGKPGNVIIEFRYLSDKISVLKAAKKCQTEGSIYQRRLQSCNQKHEEKLGESFDECKKDELESISDV